jgi:hypothetical protein
MKNLAFSLLAVLAALSLFPLLARADSARKAQEIADSGKPVAVKGGERFAVPMDYNGTFDAVVNALKKADNEIAVADRDAGLIATEIEIVGGWKQTGTRTVVSLIKESDKETTVKVVVTVQKRYKALQVEPWSDPKADTAKTGPAAGALKTALGAK